MELKQQRLEGHVMPQQCHSIPLPNLSGKQEIIRPLNFNETETSAFINARRTSARSTTEAKPQAEAKASQWSTQG
jgi:hypothetical protein